MAYRSFVFIVGESSSLIVYFNGVTVYELYATIFSLVIKFLFFFFAIWVTMKVFAVRARY